MRAWGRCTSRKRCPSQNGPHPNPLPKGEGTGTHTFRIASKSAENDFIRDHRYVGGHGPSDVSRLAICREICDEAPPLESVDCPRRVRSDRDYGRLYRRDGLGHAPPIERRLPTDPPGGAPNRHRARSGRFGAAGDALALLRAAPAMGSPVASQPVGVSGQLCVYGIPPARPAR